MAHGQTGHQGEAVEYRKECFERHRLGGLEIENLLGLQAHLAAVRRNHPAADTLPHPEFLARRRRIKAEPESRAVDQLVKASRLLCKVKVNGEVVRLSGLVARHEQRLQVLFYLNLPPVARHDAGNLGGHGLLALEVEQPHAVVQPVVSHNVMRLVGVHKPLHYREIDFFSFHSLKQLVKQ